MTKPVVFLEYFSHMKSSRLLSLLLLLQVRPHMTTREIAERLEVSTRTVLRDVEALSAAGVPVFTQQGRNGGVILLRSARLNLSHLDPAELDALGVAGLDETQRARLGLAAAFGRATSKVDARRATGPAPDRSLASVVLVDNAPWFAPATETNVKSESVDVAALAVDLLAGRRLAITYRSSGQSRARRRTVDPYGLVAKAGQWYLVADSGGEPRLFNLRRMARYSVGEVPARRRAGATLASEWDALRRRTEVSGDVVITARVRTSRVDMAARILGGRLDSVGDPDSAGPGWSLVIVRYREYDAVRHLLQFGENIEVLEPAPAREVMEAVARDLAARHATSPTA